MWSIIHGIAFLGNVFSPETYFTFDWTGQDVFSHLLACFARTNLKMDERANHNRKYLKIYGTIL